MTEKLPTIAAVGGTGNLGQGLAYRLARLGYPFVIGSRESDRAKSCAQALSRRAGRAIDGMANAEAAAMADIVFLTVPWAHHRDALESVREPVQGKIFVDPTVPLVPPKVSRVQLPDDGMAAVQSQILLGENVRVVSAFHNVAAVHLKHDEPLPECDVLVSGNDPEARELVVQLAEAIGLRAWHAGPIENTAVAETLTSALLFINHYYKIRGAGIRIIGEPGEAA